MLEHDTTPHTDQTAGSMESSSGPGPQRVEHLNSRRLLYLKGRRSFILLSAPVSFMVSLVACALPAPPLLPWKVVLPVSRQCLPSCVSAAPA